MAETVESYEKIAFNFLLDFRDLKEETRLFSFSSGDFISASGMSNGKCKILHESIKQKVDLLDNSSKLVPMI